jgi:hypothetical protein
MQILYNSKSRYSLCGVAVVCLLQDGWTTRYSGSTRHPPTHPTGCRPRSSTTSLAGGGAVEQALGTPFTSWSYDHTAYQPRCRHANLSRAHKIHSACVKLPGYCIPFLDNRNEGIESRCVQNCFKCDKYYRRLATSTHMDMADEIVSDVASFSMVEAQRVSDDSTASICRVEELRLFAVVFLITCLAYSSAREDGSSTFLRNVAELPGYTVSRRIVITAVRTTNPTYHMR